METNLLLYHIVDKHRTIFVLYLLNSPFFLAKQIESSFEASRVSLDKNNIVLEPRGNIDIRYQRSVFIR